MVVTQSLYFFSNSVTSTAKASISTKVYNKFIKLRKRNYVVNENDLRVAFFFFFLTKNRFRCYLHTVDFGRPPSNIRY